MEQTTSNYSSYDVLSRWSRIFDVLMTEDIRVLGFSTDGDAKNLRAMRNSMAFFTKDKTIFLNHPNIFKISSLKVYNYISKFSTIGQLDVLSTLLCADRLTVMLIRQALIFSFHFYLPGETSEKVLTISVV